ncbi:stomatin-like protein 2, mitochondrial [Dendroctonus ponderosae]|uniref:Band 7 domain-containing protein n=2 Tax=Dendroctonus ponderosae TaxID=77166 RepID=A0AAR5PN73_DENPD|nr:stomatin-like protein 2, mitochondrial [Dendroctonus ponderosae]
MFSRSLARTVLQIKPLNNAWKQAALKHKSYTPINTVVMFVPQQEAWIVERMGKFHRILEPGLNILIPIADRVKYVQSLKEIAVDIPKQSAITSDNVTLSIDGVLYLRIVDPYLTSYGVEDPEFAITQLAQTTMRSELGKISLDKVFRERESLNVSMVESINKASEAWGMTCLRYEIRDIKLPQRVQEAMQMQVEAERKKRAAVLESEGVRAADINVAEGKRQARILASEAEKQEQINKASGEAAAIRAVAEARAKGIQVVADALLNEQGSNAAALTIAEQYVGAFENLARTNNTLILPANANDISSMVTQALTVYSTITKDNIQQKKQAFKKILPLKPQDNLEEYFSDEEDLKKHREKMAELDSKNCVPK